MKLDAPLHVIEAQLGALVARDVDGQAVEGKAGETVDAAPLRPPITLTASGSPCRVKLWYESEARAYEAGLTARRR